jgi:hypothetical protein
MKRIGLGPLTVEGVAEGTYEMLQESEVEKLRRALQGGKEIKEVNEVKEKRKDSTQRSQRAEAQRKAGREQKQIPRTA